MAEKEATIAVAVMEATKKEAIDSMRCYKALAAFEDEVREAVCDRFIKGFEKCKRKMGQLFHLPDLHDVIPVEPEEDSSDAKLSTEEIQAELPGLEAAKTCGTTLLALPPVP